MSQSDKILIIEDDWKIINLIEIHLNDLGFQVDRATDGEAGLEKVHNNEYALIILDIMLPKKDGMEVCKSIRRTNPYTPILMLTAKDDELDRVLGLEIGADDYITKPFSVREFIARVKAILRRMQADEAKIKDENHQPKLVIGDLEIDVEKHKVLNNGRPVELTAKEFDLLLLFARNPGRIYSREILLDIVWGYQYSGYDHTVNSHINRLRNKIEKDASNPRYIKTLWGVGYKFAEPEELKQ